MRPLSFYFVLLLTAVVPLANAAGSAGVCDSLLSSKPTGEQVAESAGLHYVTPGGPGIRRVGNLKRGFKYRDSSGAVITDSAELDRIRALGIPPGYKDVWISEDPKAHIQATAMDAKGREQYRYHPDWIAAKADVKFSRMLQFGSALGTIHQAEDEDLALDGLPKNKMLAALAKVLEKTSIRVGNERYAIDNESFGLTTLLNDRKQVTVSGNTIHFNFKGKSGVFHKFDLEDPALAVITRQSLKLHQAQAFEFVDEDGVAHSIESSDLNAYLKQISGGSFSAKDFRTWGGTTFTAKFLMEAPVPANRAEASKNISQAIEYAASRLGNTPAICRSNYVDPRLLDAYLNGDFASAAKKVSRRSTSTLKPEEQLVLLLLGR